MTPAEQLRGDAAAPQEAGAQLFQPSHQGQCCILGLQGAGGTNPVSSCPSGSRKAIQTRRTLTCSPAAQKSSFRTCRAVEDSVGSARGGREPSSGCADFTSEPNTHDLMTGKQMPRPGEGKRREFTTRAGEAQPPSLLTSGEAGGGREAAALTCLQVVLSLEVLDEEEPWHHDTRVASSVDEETEEPEVPPGVLQGRGEPFPCSHGGERSQHEGNAKSVGTERQAVGCQHPDPTPEMSGRKRPLGLR